MDLRNSRFTAMIDQLIGFRLPIPGKWSIELKSLEDVGVEFFHILL